MIRVKTLRAHYYGRDVKEPGEVYEGVEPAIYQLISSGKVEVTDERPAQKPRARPMPAKPDDKED